MLVKEHNGLHGSICIITDANFMHFKIPFSIFHFINASSNGRSHNPKADGIHFCSCSLTIILQLKIIEERVLKVFSVSNLSGARIFLYQRRHFHHHAGNQLEVFVSILRCDVIAWQDVYDGVFLLCVFVCFLIACWRDIPSHSQMLNCIAALYFT